MVRKYVVKRKKRDPNKVLAGIKHGRSGYGRGCGCDVCCQAEHDYQQKRKAQGLQPRNGQSFRAVKDDNEATVTQMPRRLHSVNSTGTEDDSGSMTAAEEKDHNRKPGRVERLTAEECEALSIAQERPGTVAQALQLARIMDNPKQIGLWPTTSRQLQSILSELRGSSKKKSKGRLARVQSLTATKVVQ